MDSLGHLEPAGAAAGGGTVPGNGPPGGPPADDNRSLTWGAGRVPTTVGCIRAMICTKTRLLWQSLRAKRSVWSIPIIALLALAWAFSVGTAAQEMLAFFQRSFLEGIAVWLLSLVLVYGLTVVFSSDLIMGHTLNVGQMSTDLVFLTTLPIPPTALLGVKLFERLMADWIGVLILLSGFLGVVCRDGLVFGPVVLAIVVFLQLELLMGLGITILSILLQRVARPAAVNNTFSLFGYLSAFGSLLPYVLVSARPVESFWWIIQHSGNFQGWLGTVLTPFRWIVETLLHPALGTPFWSWSALWAGSMVAGAALFHQLTRWQWLTFVHPGLKMRGSNGPRWFSGMIRKEFLLLKGDFNLLTNSLFMPVTILLTEVWVFKGMIEISTLTRAMNMMAAASMYFCLFGPVNAVGSEGKAIALLETLPLSPGRLLGQKVLFWATMALTFFLPASAGAAWYLGLTPVEGTILLVWLSCLTVVFIWIAVSMSALYPNFDGKVLQQRSTLTGKMLAALAMGIGIPAKEFTVGGILAGVVFLLLAVSLHRKAEAAVAGRLDPDRFHRPQFEAHDAFLIVLCTMGVQVFIGALTSSLTGSASRTLFPWLTAYLISMLILARVTWTYTQERFAAAREALGWKKPQHWDTGLLLIGFILLGGFAAFYLQAMDQQGFEVFSSSAAVWRVTAALAGPGWGLGLLILILCGIAPVVEECFFRGFVDQAFRTRGWTGIGGLMAGGGFFALQHPPLSMPLVLLVGIWCAWLFRRTGSLWPGIIGHALYNGVILAIHAAHLP